MTAAGAVLVTGAVLALCFGAAWLLGLRLRR